MFEKRLKWFSIFLALVALIIVARLIDIQILQAGDFEALAIRQLTRPTSYLPAPRGSIRDRNGRPLLSDVPAADICFHYGVLTGRPGYLNQVARELHRRGEYPEAMPVTEIEDELRRDIAAIWQRLSELTGRPIAEFIERAQQLQRRVERIRAAVKQEHGYDQPVKEENWLHPMIRGAPESLAMAVRLELESSPWIKYPLLRAVPSSRRIAQDADPFVHLLGRLGQADPARIAKDPLRGDDLRELRPGDRCGISGVEYLAETTLRGARGKVIEDFDGNIIARAEPIPGRDVYLTIDADLQREVLRILEEGVQSSENAAGGSAVVIDVATRDVLALVSYPVYSYDRVAEPGYYSGLLRRTIDQPTRFRAVANQYPPGSTCKVITLAGALSDGKVSESERIHCTGHLLPNRPDRFRCWIFNQYRATHDQRDPLGQTAEMAIQNSCNIYLYQVGQRLGPERLCEWFSKFGLGRAQIPGLIEETNGIVPNAEWLANPRRKNPRRHQRADAWNFAIGQGEVTATPLQSANVAATIASGYWAPVNLLRDESGDPLGPPPPPPREHFQESVMRVLRAGMWRVVNEQNGTGRYGRLETPGYELCGKTGSAQTSRRPLSTEYLCRWSDGREQKVIAISRQDALDRFPDDRPDEIKRLRTYELFPAPTEDGKLPAHAWFIAFTQPTSTRRGQEPRDHAYAISVLIEFGASGGRVAGPLTKQIAELLLERDGSPQ